MSIELSLLIVFYLLAEEDKAALLEQMTDRLETRNNTEQQYGDWGILTVFPFYRQVHHQVEKSMAPYRYHNGGDWPYWDGIYALAKLMSGDAEWRYPLTRWFQVAMDNGWLMPVEYYGPTYGKGSNLQGWSSMPAAAMLMGGVGLLPRLDAEKVHLKVPPWGNFSMKHIHLRGSVYDIAYHDGVWTIESEDGANEHPFVVGSEGSK
jgi:glycogen debranching enzyme